MRAGIAVALRPDLWSTALRTFAVTVPRGWWRRPPFVPVPDRSYLRFRLETQYGRSTAPQSTDLVRYLEWCRAERRACARGRERAHR
jgi:hypothetical protein